MDLGTGAAISADSPAIYHAIVPIATEDVTNVDKEAILRVIVRNMETVIIVVAEIVLIVENLGIMPGIVMKRKIIMRMIGAQLRDLTNVSSVESLATFLVTVHDQEVEKVVLNAAKMVITPVIVKNQEGVQAINVILVENMDILPKIVVVIRIIRNAIVVANLVISNEIAIKNQNAITADVLVT